MVKLILLRHGESTWNKENKFTGWTDVPLSRNGIREAKSAGEQLKNVDFEIAYTSYLKRAIKTLWIVLEQTNKMWIPVYRTWKLNERHYGALQGLNKQKTALKYGEEQVFLWRRGYAVRPPALSEDDKRHPKYDMKYQGIRKLPSTESLKDTVRRVMPYWKKSIVPQLQQEKNVLLVAHGNSLRALVKELEGISDDDITQLNIPTGVPLVYELNEELQIITKHYLGDEKAIKNKIKKVASQAKAK